MMDEIQECEAKLQEVEAKQSSLPLTAEKVSDLQTDMADWKLDIAQVKEDTLHDYDKLQKASDLDKEYKAEVQDLSKKITDAQQRLQTPVPSSANPAELRQIMEEHHVCYKINGIHPFLASLQAIYIYIFCLVLVKHCKVKYLACFIICICPSLHVF